MSVLSEAFDHSTGPWCCRAELSLPRPADPLCGHPSVDTAPPGKFCCFTVGGTCAVRIPTAIDAQWWPCATSPLLDCQSGRRHRARNSQFFSRAAGLHCTVNSTAGPMRNAQLTVLQAQHPMRQASHEACAAGLQTPTEGTGCCSGCIRSSDLGNTAAGGWVVPQLA